MARKRKAEPAQIRGNPPAPESPAPPPAGPKASEADGPGLYLCTRTCYGARIYEKGGKYRLEKNLCPKHFARVGE